MGKVGDGKTVSTADVVHFTKVKSKPTQQKILDQLAAKGVVTKQNRKPALVAEKYRPQQVGEAAALVQSDDVVSALVNLGKKKSEAAQLAAMAKGSTVEERIKSNGSTLHCNNASEFDSQCVKYVKRIEYRYHQNKQH